MRAMLLERTGGPLVAATLDVPRPGTAQVLVRVEACGVCRTDLHLMDGELPDPRTPIVPGHEIVGRVVKFGPGVAGLAPGRRVGIPWLGHTCGHCGFCLHGQENLCDEARFTGCHIHGGYAEFTVADARYCFPIDESIDAAHAAPLLCAGLIGYRALVMAGEAERLGIYGFGAAAHIVTQIALWQGRSVLAFTRSGDTASQVFARSLGAQWAGDSQQAPPEPLDAALIFAPVGALVPAALRALRKGGIVVCAGIHMSEIPRLSPTTSCGANARSVRWPISRAATAKNSSPSRRASRSARKSNASRSPMPTSRSTGCAAATSRARQC